MKQSTEEKNTPGNCPVQKMATLLSDTWTILILRDILVSPMRFCELEKSLTGISTRTLTLKLTKLVEEEILERNDHHYTITKKGKALKSVIDEMEKVGRKM
jgi:DNA-binding HxlR family transcriptional regulator